MGEYEIKNFMARSIHEERKGILTCL